ncbi:MAG: MBL fold metallo-hydrolase [Litorimonas sp.]
MSARIGFVRWHPDGKTVWLYSRKETTYAAKVRDARWGDWLDIQADDPDGWSRIRWGTKTYYIRTENVVETRPLEVLFVDVGQGDGAILTSSETGDAERIYIVDAGKSSNMARLVDWRFGKVLDRFDFEAAIVTHPDWDHYGGFQALFDNPKYGFRHVYHNGLLERDGGDLLGPSSSDGRYLTDLAVTDDEARDIYSDPDVRGPKLYPKLIQTALDSDRIGPVEMLAVGHGTLEGEKTYLPSYAPSDARDATIRVVGPVPEPRGGRPRLRWFGNRIGSTGQDDGKTKNGHSVLLKLDIGLFSLLFGGDLNRPAEDYLLRHYGGVPSPRPLSDAIPGARRTFRSDMMKCCHHGASDVTDEFLRAVDAFAYVVSSGDNESHAHPRPDLLGRLGRFARGDSPMIFCTEILRSTRESGVEEDFKALRRLDRAIDRQHGVVDDHEDAGRADEAKAAKKVLRDKQAGRRALQKKIQKRNVGVYGAITLRTDGHRMEISFMLEAPRRKQRWQSFRLVHDPVTEDWYDADAAGAH